MHVTAVFEHQAASYLQQKDATKLAMNCPSLNVRFLWSAVGNKTLLFTQVGQVANGSSSAACWEQLHLLWFTAPKRETVILVTLSVLRQIQETECKISSGAKEATANEVVKWKKQANKQTNKLKYTRRPPTEGTFSLNPRPHYAVEIWKRMFIFMFRPTVHTNLSRKRSFNFENALQTGGIWKCGPFV